MSHLAEVAENQSAGQGAPKMAPEVAFQCSLPDGALGPQALTSDLCSALEAAGCPLAAPVQERVRFETLLAELSAAFVNLSAGQVDSQIESALQRLVVFLGIDRGGAGRIADRPEANGDYSLLPHARGAAA